MNQITQQSGRATSPINQSSMARTKPNRARKFPPTTRMFTTPGPGAYYPSVNMETDKEIFKRTHSPQFKALKKSWEVPMLPYMVGYKAFTKHDGISLASKQGVDFRLREQQAVPSSH